MQEYSILNGVLALGFIGGFLNSASAITPDISIEEITITAKKRPMKAKDAPFAIHVLQGDDVRHLAISDAEDILSHFAGVNHNASNEVNSGFTIRGVGTSNFHGNVARAIGIYQNEISFSNPFAGNLSVFDIERVEILKGPQNTLYGRNTTGGAINLITRKPIIEDGAHSYAEASYGNYNAVTVDAALNIRLSENAALRFSGVRDTRDGFFINQLNGEKLGERETSALRAQALWQLSEKLEVHFLYGTSKNNGTNRGIKANGIGDPDNTDMPCQDDVGDFSRSTNCAIITGFNPSNDNFHDVYLAVSPRQYMKFESGFAKAVYSMASGHQLQSITSFAKTEIEYSDDTAGVNVLAFNPFQDAVFDQFSQEFRLISPNEGNLKWLIGGLYFTEKLDQATYVRRDANPAAPPGPGVNAEALSYNLLDQKDQDYSLYGQLDYALTDMLRLAVGFRYTHNDKKARSDFGVMVAPVSLLDPQVFIDRNMLNEMIAAGANDPRIVAVPVSNFPLFPEQTLDKLTGEIELSYMPNESLMVYGRYARGFKSGGFDTRALAALFGDAGLPVGPEVLDAYELGVKMGASDKLQINSAAFYYDWTGAQVFAAVEGVPSFANIPRSRVMGLDVDLTWTPGSDWVVVVSASLLDSKITNAGNLSGVSEGHKLNNAPSFSSAGRISKIFNMGHHSITLLADAQYVGKRFETVDNSTDFAGLKPSFFELNARVEVDIDTDDLPLSVAFWVKNITGAQYCVEKRLIDPPGLGAVAGSLTGSVQCTPNDGKALFGLSLRTEF